MSVKINKEACLGCGACIGACPTEALSLGNDGKITVDASRCIDCGACTGTCPVDALKL